VAMCCLTLVLRTGIGFPRKDPTPVSNTQDRPNTCSEKVAGCDEERFCVSHSDPEFTGHRRLSKMLRVERPQIRLLSEGDWDFGTGLGNTCSEMVGRPLEAATQWSPEPAV
jgi:hypothetical protein